MTRSAPRTHELEHAADHAPRHSVERLVRPHLYPVVLWQRQAHFRLDRGYLSRESPTSDWSVVAGLPHLGRQTRHVVNPRRPPKEMRLSFPRALVCMTEGVATHHPERFQDSVGQACSPLVDRRTSSEIPRLYSSSLRLWR